MNLMRNTSKLSAGFDSVYYYAMGGKMSLGISAINGRNDGFSMMSYALSAEEIKEMVIGALELNGLEESFIDFTQLEEVAREHCERFYACKEKEAGCYGFACLSGFSEFKTGV